MDNTEKAPRRFSSWVRGGQSTLHSIRMAAQVVRALGFGSLFAFLVPFALICWNNLDRYDLYVTWKYYQADLLYGLRNDPGTLGNFQLRDGTNRVLPYKAVISNPAVLETVSRVKEQLLDAAATAVWVAGLGAVLVLLVFFFRDPGKIRRQFLRGNRMASVAQTKKAILKSHRKGAPPPYWLGPLPYPTDAEKTGTIVAGTTGTGKSQLLHRLIPQIRERGDRAIIYDKMGVYTEAYFDTRHDVILNAIDKRSPYWSLISEARVPTDFDMIMQAFIPKGDGQGAIFNDGARLVASELASGLRAEGVIDNESLVEELLRVPLERISEIMSGSDAQALIDAANPRTAMSTRMVLATYMRSLSLLPKAGPHFSIRKWVSDDQREGFLFLPSRGDMHASLKPLASMFLEIAINQALSLRRSSDRRLWIILDELPSLHEIPSLIDGMAQLRQFGVCFVLGIQAYAQLREIYGEEGARTINNLCRTKALFAMADDEEAEWAASNTGEREVDELKEGMSYGAHAMRDGVNLNWETKPIPLVHKGEFKDLPALNAFVRFPGGFPSTRINLRYQEPPRAAQAYVMRELPFQALANYSPAAKLVHPAAPTPKPGAAVIVGGKAQWAADASSSASTEPPPAAKNTAEPPLSNDPVVPPSAPNSGKKRKPAQVRKEMIAAQAPLPIHEENAAPISAFDGPPEEPPPHPGYENEEPAAPDSIFDFGRPMRKEGN